MDDKDNVELMNAIDVLVNNFLDETNAPNFKGFRVTDQHGREFTVLVHKTGGDLPTKDVFE